MKTLLSFLLLFYSSFLFANAFDPKAQYQLCFTPGQNCTDEIITALNHARESILVQAYSFTSAPIARALIAAQKRGVKVKVILDKTQTKGHGFSVTQFFADYHIPVYIDFQPAIAHNKVMIIDSTTVITGSFNFTRAAQEKNAENVLIIADKELAKKYRHYWNEREGQSDVYEPQSRLFNE